MDYLFLILAVWYFIWLLEDPVEQKESTKPAQRKHRVLKPKGQPGEPTKRKTVQQINNGKYRATLELHLYERIRWEKQNCRNMEILYDNGEDIGEYIDSAASDYAEYRLQKAIQQENLRQSKQALNEYRNDLEKLQQGADSADIAPDLWNKYRAVLGEKE